MPRARTLLWLLLAAALLALTALVILSPAPAQPLRLVCPPWSHVAVAGMCR